MTIGITAASSLFQKTVCSIKPYGGFLKWGYPQFSSIFIGLSIINHQFWGVPPPFMATHMWKNMPHDSGRFQMLPEKSSPVSAAQVVTFNALLNACERARFAGKNCLARNWGFHLKIWDLSRKHHKGWKKLGSFQDF